MFALITFPAALSGAARTGTAEILFTCGRFCYDRFEYRTASTLFGWAARMAPNHVEARNHLTITGWLLGANKYEALDAGDASLLLGCSLEKTSVAEAQSRLRRDIALGDAAYNKGAFDLARTHYRYAQDTVRWFPYNILGGVDRRFQRRLRELERRTTPEDG